MHELKATVIVVVLAGLAVCGGCSKNSGSSPSVSTSTHFYTVGVAADQLNGRGLKVQNNGGDDLFLTRNAKYKFSTPIADGDTYDVTVATQPILPSQTCTVLNGTGTIHGQNVNVIVKCVTNKYTVGGTISGLDGEVVLQDFVSLSGPETLTLANNDPLQDKQFTFAKEHTDGRNYSVSVTKQPSVQTCTIKNSSGTLKGVDVNDVAVNCVDNVPTVSLQDASVVEGDAGTGYMEFSVGLSLLARNDITVDYATSDATATVADNDYTDTTGQLTIYAGTSSATIAVPVLGDTNSEANETLTLTLSNPLMLSSPVTNLTFSGTGVATGTIYNDDGGALNDTGITGCANADTNSLACNSATDGTDVYPGQDAEFGRDVTVTEPTPPDGHAGFSFEKIANDGLPLADQSLAWDPGGSEAANTQWSCVLDNTTQLMWEVKTTDGGVHDKGLTYTWYDSDSSTNGGDPGTPGGGSCSATLTACDTERLVQAVNADGFCGHSDWRLPTLEELSSLIDSSVSPGPTIDGGWFPNTLNGLYWTSSPYASYTYYAWTANFASGGVIGSILKQTSYPARLVRGGR